MSQITENIAILLGFILSTLIAAGIIFFIVIGISMLTGIIPPNTSHSTYDDGITGPGEGVSGLPDTYDYNLTYYNYTVPLNGSNRTYAVVTDGGGAGL